MSDTSKDLIIHKLKTLIEEWEDEKQTLENMVNIWEQTDDPSCDPGLQYEQEMRVTDCMEEISNFCKNFF